MCRAIRPSTAFTPTFLLTMIVRSFPLLTTVRAGWDSAAAKFKNQLEIANTHTHTVNAADAYHTVWYVPARAQASPMTLSIAIAIGAARC